MIILSKIIPVMFLSVGVILLMQVILPTVSFQVWLLQQKYSSSLLVSPTKRTQVLGVSVQNQDQFPAFVSTFKRENQVPYRQFFLSVPKLKIERVQVLVDSNELTKGLVHLPGSALPGEKGNVFISGHSALSPLFSFKSALFAKLTDLKKGDQIMIEASGVKFRYQIYEAKVIDPKDLSVTQAPEPQGRYISLMTCVPPGLNFKRLVVLGKML